MRLIICALAVAGGFTPSLAILAQASQPASLPAMVTTRVTSAGVELSWSAVPGVGRYTIFRAPATPSSASLLPVGTVAAGTTMYLDAGGKAGMLYRVRAEGATTTQSALVTAGASVLPPVSERTPVVLPQGMPGRAPANAPIVQSAPPPPPANFTVAGISPAQLHANVFTSNTSHSGPPPVVTITGTGFNKRPEIAVFFTGPSGSQDIAGTVDNRTDGSFTATLPPTAKSGSVKVVIGTGAAAETALTPRLDVFAPLTVTRNTGFFIPGNVWKIHGTGYRTGKVDVVLIDTRTQRTIPFYDLAVESDSVISTLVPEDTGSALQLRITRTTATDKDILYGTSQLLLLPMRLEIVSVQPVSGGGVGSPVTIMGYGLTSPVVTFANGVRATSVQVGSPTITTRGFLDLIVVTIPAGAVTGPITITTTRGTATTAKFTVH